MRKILWCFALLGILTCGGSAEASIITFEDLGVAVGNQLNPASGVGVVTGGFNYTPGPNNTDGLNDLHIGNQVSFFPFNGTTVGVTHSDVVLTKVGGGSFSLQAFDFAGWPTNNEVAFTVSGIRADASTISVTFTPDGLVDGPGGVVDFQTFTLSSAWNNLVSVTWTQAGAGTTQGLFGLDNIVVDQASPIPEPTTLIAFGVMALGGAGYVRRRKVAATA